MATLAQSIVSSSSRKLAIRVRPDLKARKQRYQGRVYWVVKDPVGLQYFRFEEEEFAILQMLDGESSLEEIAERFEKEFPPQTIRVEELQNFIGMLHRSGLVLSDSAGQGVQLKKRRDEKRKQELIQNFSNILSFRMRGIDPEGILNAIYPWVRWFFSVPATICACILAFCALSLVIVQFDVFQSKLPSFHSFFAAQNWLVIAGVLAITKIIHEFGHGLSCKHFGGECHEMGIMLLVLTPCLYCNVSDSWMLPNRWHRAAIGAAGMYVEVVIASIATFIWWFSEPGFLNYLCLNIMFVSSVSTIVFNANPLLRYDGYYILSDLMEIPNLRQKASTILNRKLGWWCLGLEEPDDPFLPHRHQGWFALYTVASFFYRWFVLLSILYFLNKVFEPYGLKILGQAIALASLYGMIVMPFWKVFKFFRIPGRVSKVKKVRMFASLALLSAVVGGILFIPFPSSVTCEFELQPRGAESVYIDVPGTLEEVMIEPGQHVEKDQLLAQLSNIDLELEVERLQGQREANQAQLDSLYQLQFHDQNAGLQIDVVRKRLSSLDEQLAQKQRDLDRLQLIAPRAGTVIPPPYRPEARSNPEVELASWSGWPMEEKNLGATFSPDGSENLFCHIGDPNEWDAVLVINQRDLDLLREGQEVRLMFNESAYHVFVSTLESMADDEMKNISPRLASTSGGAVPAQHDPGGEVKPLTTSYQAEVKLDNSLGMFRNGLTGTARIKTEPRTLASRLFRYVKRTFNFDL
ncbi:biotin/lipoyl-binding protein [Bythopirellula polymerisocia]|uniref:Putative peptide zinc metalloprotease protein YydH n=1 Tax=Bythopirellula polymerisocia TaxID=2528003 RepID=A0A5C6D0L3_9BACT|nr:biotin/lipoyl-binding protein [Bythopirellula polymerisocia]TWU30410.1 putative peptide zinc metalloprotease protein YydH [Bythopirellula polymerisocia]